MSLLPDATTNTPLAPSVEKAYYRKCIELKRRLNEVEAANDEAKVKRVRLERGILKMRLERAFLLDELKKRMEYNGDDSEASGEEMAEAPPDNRPHRDKRRRQQPSTMPPAGPPLHSHQPPTGVPRQPSDPHMMKREYGHPDMLPSQAYPPRGGGYLPPPEYAAQQQPQHPLPGPPPPLPSNAYAQQSSPYPMPPRSADRRAAAAEEYARGINGQAGVTGETLSAAPPVREGAVDERRVASSDMGGGPRELEGGFTAVNN